MSSQGRRSYFWAVLAAGLTNGLFGQVLYVLNNLDGTISSYVYAQDSGYLSEILPRTAAGGAPTSIAIHPNRKFAYVAMSGPSLAAFSISASTGALTLVDRAPLTPGSAPQAVVIDPSGGFAFVAHASIVNGASIVSAFSVNSSTGALTAVPGSPFSGPASATSVVVHPNGKFAYVSGSTVGQVAAFNIGTNGTLSPVDGSPFAARMNIAGMAMDAAGKFLFVAQRQDNAVLVYSVNATTGALTQVGSPFPTAGVTVTGVAVDSAGKFLYASNAGSGSVSVFSIGDTGALTRRANIGAVLGASAVILDPAGRFLYVPGQQADAIRGFAIDASTGGLTASEQFYPAGRQPLRGAAVLLDPPILPPISADAVFNLLSRAPQGLPNAAIAQGSQLVIEGKNIGPAPSARGQFPLPTELGGVSVQIQSGDIATKALMDRASPGSITCVVPSTTPLGDATLTVTFMGRTTAPLPITIVRTSVGIGARNATGYGPSVAWNVPPDIPIRLDESILQIPNTLNQSAKPGQTMVIQATGLGPVAVDETGEFLLELDVPAEVMAGNQRATVIAKVRADRGKDFILFKLPDDVPQGCYVPIAVLAGGVTSNTTSISVSASGGACSDPTGFSSSDLEGAQKSGSLSVGVIQFNRFDLGGNPYSEASGRFVRYGAEPLLDSFAANSGAFGARGSFALPPLGTCTVARDRPDLTPAQPLNVGQALNLSGPNGRLQLAAPNYSFEAERDVFTPGDYTVDNGTGTAAFGPFSAAITLPPPVKWTNQDTLTSADRSQDLSVTWTGGVTDKEFVMILGSSQGEKSDIGFLCTEKVSAGKFTVPAWVLSSLPASAAIPRDEGFPSGYMAILTAPLTSAARFSGPGLDFGIFTYEQGMLVAVPFK